jgi:hypothetical protein
MHTTTRTTPAVAASLVALLIHCGGAATPGAHVDGGEVSGPATHDASTHDSGAHDGGTRDGGTHDGGTHDGGAHGEGGVASCGCNGKAGCAEWNGVYVTWYGYNDNSCGSEAQHGCNDIADPGLGPKMHESATAGAGTYDDPSTAAASDTMDPGHVYETADGVTLTPGTLIYNPEVEQYFIFEDSCLECGDEYSCKLSSDDTDDPDPPAGCKEGANIHIDFWMGPSNAQQPASLQTCEDNATIGNPYAGSGVVIVNPPPDLPVRPGLLYPGNASATGGCFTAKPVSGALSSCGAP